MEPPKVGTLPLSCPLKCQYSSMDKDILEHKDKNYGNLFLAMDEDC